MKRRIWICSVFVALFLCILACAPVFRNQAEPTKSIESSTSQQSLQSYLERAEWDQHSTIPFSEPDGFELENGLRVFVVEQHDLPMVYARAQIRGGSIYDPPGKSGLAYLTGWVLTEGTESYPDEVIDAEMDRHGAFVTSVAYNESCIATLNCLSKDAMTLFPYFAEILSRANFEESNLDEGRNYIIGDLMQTADDPGSLCYRRFRVDVFRDHPYAKPHKGKIDELETISREDVLNFYKTYYRPDHAVLVLVGDITVDQVKTLCHKYLGSWSRAEQPLCPIPAPKPLKGLHINIIDKDTVQAQLNIGHIGINRINPDRFKIDVMNRILGGGGLFSRLATEVRVKRGLTYGVYSFFARREFTGEFAVSTFTKVETLGETVRVILTELQKIREEPVTDDELKDAKQGLIGSYPLRFEKYEGIAETLVHRNFYGLPMDDITRYPQHINSVTKEQVQQTASNFIHPDNLIITIVGPADKIKPQVEDLGSVRVVPEI
jgi:zinc protease